MAKRQSYSDLERISRDWTAKTDSLGYVWYEWNLPASAKGEHAEYVIRKVAQGPAWQLAAYKNSFDVEYTYYDTPEEGQKAAFTKHFGLLYALAIFKDEDDDTHI